MSFALLGVLWEAALSLLLRLGYLRTQSSFPQPLSREQEALYLDDMRHEDSERRRRAFDVLVERNLRLVAHVAKKFGDTGEDSDDLISIGTIGLIKGIKTFDPGRGTRLATYAARCVENEIRMHLRSMRKLKREISLQEPIGVDGEGNEITLMDILSHDGESLIELVDRQLLRRALERVLQRLGDRERRVLVMRYGLLGGRRHTQKEVAEVLGISRSYVSRIEKSAVSNVGRELSWHNG